MDTSFWIRCNPKVTVEHTTKKYYGKYLYKIVVYAPAGRIMDSKNNDLQKAYEHRLCVSKHINQSSWHMGAYYHRDLEKADLQFLQVLRHIKKNVAGIKMRIEEPRVQIYAASEDQLIHLVLDHLQPFVKHIESIAGPENPTYADILNSGAILRKTNNGYTHKVLIRDGRYTPETKASILGYLESLGAEVVKLPQSAVEMLTKTSGYIWNMYFFTNDPSVLMFLNLIQPGLILNCHELVVLE
jgi:hypothetical protein